MNIHEYQGKSILQAHGVAVQEGFVAISAGQAVTVAEELRSKLLQFFQSIHIALAEMSL